MALHRTKYFTAECKTEGNASVCWIGEASSRRQAFAICAREMKGLKITSFHDETEMCEYERNGVADFKRGH
jgi:hypothetical protein